MANSFEARHKERADSRSLTFTSMEQYVAEMEGRCPVRKILIANNGISAVKAIRSIRKWSYEMFGDERFVKFVSMATPEDIKANAVYIHMADQVEVVPGGSNNNNYANVMLIVEIAEKYEVDAVWAGWGHASENPILPETLAKTERQILFIGPSGKPMRALGDKIGSTIIAQSAKVPTISWNGDGITVNYKELNEIPDSIYKEAMIKDVDHCVAECDRIGYPVMIKASEGGGGKGIRKVTKREDVAAAFTAVQGEIPGSPIFVMRLAPKSRHLEVQLLADEYGNAISLSGRDCSVQRRHQKIIEEGPVLAPPPHVWEQMERAATRLAREVDYVNAGTVEYLYTEQPDENGNSFFFLELNPRLQVEHPVTEMITGVNLPACQLQVAMGIPLYRIPDIRRFYLKESFGSSLIDFENDPQASPQGHVIAARITAENPNAGFQPTSGELTELNFKSTPDVWGYFSVDASGRVHEFADSQIGHLFSWSTSRERARKNLVLALKQLTIRGDIHTTVEYISKMIESNDFVQNQISTSWLDERIARHKELRLDGKPDTLMVVLVGASCIAHQNSTNRSEKYVYQLERGQLPSFEYITQKDQIELIYEGVKYNIEAIRSGTLTFTLYCNKSYIQVNVRTLSDGGYLVLLNGKSHVAYATKEAQGLRLIVDGNTCVFTNEYDPTRLVTNAAGKLARYLVKDGAKIRRNTPYAEMEVMKMYMPLLTQEDGVIHLVKPEGAVLAPGDLIARLELEDSSCVKKSDQFLGTLDMFQEKNEDAVTNNKAIYRVKTSIETLCTVLDGYIVPEDIVTRAEEDLFESLRDKLLPVDEIKEILSSLAGRIPISVYEQVSDKIQSYKEYIAMYKENSQEFNAQAVLQIMNDYKTTLNNPNDVSVYESKISTLFDIVSKYTNGLQSRRDCIINDLLKQYHTIESMYANTHNIEDIVMSQRQQLSDDLMRVYHIARAHASIEPRSGLILRLLQRVRSFNDSAHSPQPQDGAGDVAGVAPNGTNNAKSAIYLPLLENIASFKGRNYSLVALEARHILMDRKMPSYRERLHEIETIFRQILQEKNTKLHETSSFQYLLDQTQPIFDLLISHLDHKDAEIRDCALDLYIRRIYRSYDIQKMTTNYDSTFLYKKFEFKSPTNDALSVGGLAHAESYDDLASLLNRGSSVFNRDDTGNTSANNGNSDSETSIPSDKIPPNALRHGLIATFNILADLSNQFMAVLDLIPKRTNLLQSSLNKSHLSHIHVLHFIILNQNQNEEDLLETIQQVIAENKDNLQQHSVRRITFSFKPSLLINNTNSDKYSLYPSIYTYRQGLNFQEDRIVRHMEAPLAYMLELKRLKNYNVQTVHSKDKNVHLYLATPKKSALLAANTPKSEAYQRFFVRAVVRQLEKLDDASVLQSQYDAHPGPERTLVDSLNALELAMGQYNNSGMTFKNNHVFLNVAPEAIVDPQYLEAVIRILASRYADRLASLRVTQVELKISAKFAENDFCIPVRLVAANPTGFVLRVEAYVETEETRNGLGVPIFTSIGDDVHGSLDGLSVDTPYPVSYSFDTKREIAKKMSDTLYVYDFLALLEHGLIRLWRKFAHEMNNNVQIPRHIMKYQEMILNKDDKGIEFTSRNDGENDVGMVAWLITMCTPEFKDGREIVLIANDITFKAGSFGTREDKLFKYASEYARANGLPRFYFAANAGARIGMAESIKSKYQVCWKDPQDPSKGYNYLYLTPSDYEYFNSLGAVNAKLLQIHTEGRDGAVVEDRYVIEDIIGEEIDLGVENLQGSGAIAGETSRAYHDIFTLTYVCGRSVGIGAYLVRLGHRTIQNLTSAPIILTGYQALNKLMGNSVYTSNDQLGGVKVMHNNGVTHLTATNHMQGILSMLTWLSFVPAKRGGELPVRELGNDKIDRQVEFKPTRGVPYDVRELLVGRYDEVNKSWISGFMDKDSFIETLSGWAKTVVVGRARLGGIPCGVVVTEVRTVEKLTPADPASPNTQESLVQQAGQVWFPDSAHKTATAIRDFNGEGLPLFIFANWRGFSGGQRDMFDEVLKFGAEIVDNLVQYKQPVFVYIPPFGELRGGAWVVVDSTINEEVMEMYADADARGGVLEPAGLIEIKYRKPQLLATAHRVDAVLQKLTLQLDGLPPNDVTRDGIVRDIRLREAKVLPIFTQIATQFADLHDTPGRMKSKNVIREMVPWKISRSYFCWRLKRRLAEFKVRNEIVRASKNSVTFLDSLEQVKSWFLAATTNNGGDESKWDNDQVVLNWFQNAKDLISNKVSLIKQERIAKEVMQLGIEDPKSAVTGILQLISQLPANNRDEVITALRRGSIFARTN